MTGYGTPDIASEAYEKGASYYFDKPIDLRVLKQKLTDLGIFESHGRYPWAAFHIGAMTAGRHNQLIAGEHDRFGHVYSYHRA